MQINEQQLRQIIRSMLINESTYALDANSYAEVNVDSGLYGFGIALLGNVNTGMKSELLTQLLKLFGIRSSDNQAIEPLLVGAAVTFIMEYKRNAWKVDSYVKPVRGMEPLEPVPADAPLTSVTGITWKRNNSLYTGAEPPDTLMDSIEQQIKAQLGKIGYSTFVGVLKADESVQLCLTCKSGEIHLGICVPAPLIA